MSFCADGIGCLASYYFYMKNVAVDVGYYSNTIFLNHIAWFPECYLVQNNDYLKQQWTESLNNNNDLNITKYDTDLIWYDMIFDGYSKLLFQNN